MLAAYYGYTKIVEYLLTAEPVSASPTITSHDGATALMVACQNGHFDVVEQILQTTQGVASINLQDKTGRTALHSAAWRGNEQIVEILLACRANISMVDKTGATPFLLAVAGAKPEKVVPKFLEIGVDIDTKDFNGWTPLMVSVDKGLIEITKSLINHAASSNKLGSVLNAQRVDGTTSLLLAAGNGHEKLVEELLLPLTQLDSARPLDDWPALYHATYKQSAKAVRALVNQIPAHMVGGLSSPRVREVNRRANVSGLTPLLLACLCGNSNPIVRCLLEAGASVNACDQSLFTPLMAAVQKNNEGLAKLLLSKGAHVDVQDIQGYTAMAIAAFYGYYRLTDLLITAKANPFIFQCNGRTPLLIAAEKGHHEIVKQITKRFPTAYNDACIMGRTALHYGIISQDEKTVHALCENGATALNPNILDKTGVSALMIAASNPKKVAKSEENEMAAEDSGPRNVALSVYSQPTGFNRFQAELAHVMPILRLKTLDINLRDSEGDTVLIRAYLAKNWPFAEAALRRGASATVARLKDPMMTPLIIAAANGYMQGIKLIKFIAPAAVNIPDALGRTALFHAIMNKKFEAVDYLLSEPVPADANVAATGRTGDVKTDGAENCVMGTTPLHYVALNGTPDMAEKLCAAGAKIDQKNELGEHALMLAADACNWDVFEYLLLHGSYLALKDCQGQTVLHRLCNLENQEGACRGYRLIVKHRGAEVLDTILDSPSKNTALHLAAMYDKPAIVDELIILGASKDVLNASEMTVVDSVVYGPAIFEELGRIFHNRWREMAKLLIKKALRKRYPSEDSLAIEQLFQEEIARIDAYANPEARATYMFERFYELEEYHHIDIESIVSSYELLRKSALAKSDDPKHESHQLARIAQSCRGRLVIFNKMTIQNLVKIRSTINPENQVLKESDVQKNTKNNNQKN